MKKKVSDKKLKDEIVKDFQKVLGDLGVTNILIRPRVKGDEGYLDNLEGREDWAFAVEVPFPYREVYFFISPRGFALKREGRDGVYRISIIHEVIHVIHARFFHLAQNRYTSEKELADEEEQLADTLAIILSRYI